MRRPRPIRRLVDGRPDDSGKTISRRLTLLMTPAISLANAVGATVVLFLAVYVVPLPDIGDKSAALVANFIAFGVFLGVAVFVGVVWGYRRLEPMRDWLREDRAPDAGEQRLTLRAPRRILLVNGFLWALAVVVFAAVNVVFSAGLALVVAIVVALGGMTTSAVAYLITERLLRPVVARALSRAPAREAGDRRHRDAVAGRVGAGHRRAGVRARAGGHRVAGGLRRQRDPAGDDRPVPGRRVAGAWGC